VALTGVNAAARRPWILVASLPRNHLAAIRHLDISPVHNCRGHHGQAAGTSPATELDLTGAIVLVAAPHLRAAALGPLTAKNNL
jgi:hypothetical protein